MVFLRESPSIPSRNIRVVPTRGFPLLLRATVLEPLENRSVLERTIDLEALSQLEDIGSWRITNIPVNRD